MKTTFSRAWPAILFMGAIRLAFPSAEGEARADGPPPLPPEAYAACDSKSEGDGCSVKIFDREITGTCAKETEGRLFCRPDHMPGPPHGSPRRGRNSGPASEGRSSTIGM
jgi:hypothetical protein